MCGVVGYIDIYGKPIDREIFCQMTDLLTHRGPDDRGIKIFRGKPFVALGHRRLAIIDLSPAGHQPMSNEDGTIWIVCNGEIYNFREIRRELEKQGHLFKSKSDTEVILHAYEEWGERCLDKFNGMFAFGIWGQKKRRIFLAKKLWNIKVIHPIFYWSDSDVKEYINKYLRPIGININPLYEKGFRRACECWCPVFKRKEDFILLAKHYPNLFMKLIELEKESKSGFAYAYIGGKPLYLRDLVKCLDKL